MAEYDDREHYIPLRKSELIDLLSTSEEIARQEEDAFRQLCRLLSAVFHFEYHDRLEELKASYAPFDADPDTKLLVTFTEEERQRRMEKLFTDFTWLMEKANFRHLSRDDIDSAAEGASDWGLNMTVDFDLFERLELFARGDAVAMRTRRSYFKPWQTREIQLDTYKRLVLILKLRPHRSLPKSVDTTRVYLKVFKDIPKLDLEMLLPGTRLQMPKLQRGKLGVSMASTVGFVGWKIGTEISQLASALVQRNPLAFWAPLSLVFGYGYRQYYGFQATKTNYSLRLTESLYYQNLDNNSGVLTRLLDEAEEQECREAILAYFFLWRHAGPEGWTSEELDDRIEQELERRVNLKVDFEISDGLGKLERLKLVEKQGDRYRARPLDKALETLDWTWDNYFQYNLAQPGVV